MGTYDARHGVVGIFVTPTDPFKKAAAREALGAYDWADTVFYETFKLHSGILHSDTDSDLRVSNGLHYPAGAPDGLAAAYMVNRPDMQALVPDGSSNTIYGPIRDRSNRGFNAVAQSGAWTGPDTASFVVRITTAGIGGIAKADVYSETGETISSNNTIDSGTVLPILSGMSMTFNDDGPFFLHDSWAIKGVRGGINRLAVDVDYIGEGAVDEVILQLSSDTDNQIISNLNAKSAETIVINSGLFGTPIEFPDDFSGVQTGDNLNVAVILRKDQVEDSLLVRSIIIAVGDAQEVSSWQ